MKTYKIINHKVEDKVYCDVCGNLCIENDMGSEYASLTAVWGHNSKHDGTEFEIHLCEKCFENTLNYLKKKRNGKIASKDNPFEGKYYI